MTPNEIIDHYKTKYRYSKETGMAASSLGNWLKWGYVPEETQYKLERITKGLFKIGGRMTMEKEDLKVKWPLVVIDYEKIYFNRIDLGNYTMFRMCIFKTLNPCRGMYVSIEGRGSYFFSMDRALHKNYVAEKLSLQGDHGQIADFLNAQLQIEERQQGNYYREIINGVEPYGLIGEAHVMPWVPEIVSES